MAKILLVEDDAILVEMYQAKFELEGHDVRVATNGEECLQILKEFRPELILLTNLGQAEVDMNQELAKALGVNDYLIKSHHTPDEVVQKAVKVLKSSGSSSAPKSADK